MISKRQRRIAAQKLFKRPEGEFEQIYPSENRPRIEAGRYIFDGSAPPGMTRAFRNNKFTVMIYDNSPTTHGPATKALIQKHDDTPILNHWSTIQGIKNEIFGSETTAVEYYPAESALINRHNIYWIWIFPDDVLPKKL